MSGYIDILIFALVAVVLVLRLGSILGRKMGHQQDPNEPSGSFEPDDNVVIYPKDRAQPAKPAINRAYIDGAADSDIVDQLLLIRSKDGQFDLDNFIEGAKIAFDLITHAFYEGDEDLLKPLLAPPVMKSFAQAIAERQHKGWRAEHTLIGIDSVKIISAATRGTQICITVKFVSEQVNASFDSEDQLVEGNQVAAEKVVDIWEFGRDSRNQDPNWMLLSTASPAVVDQHES